jgi:hypothetical protein
VWDFLNNKDYVAGLHSRDDIALVVEGDLGALGFKSETNQE